MEVLLAERIKQKWVLDITENQIRSFSKKRLIHIPK